MTQTHARDAAPVLSTGEREDLRSKLLAERRRLVEEYRHDVEAAQALGVEGGEDLEDLASTEQDRDRLYAHSEQDRATLRLIDDALQRMDEGTYGLCQLTGEPIPLERLRQVPWARYVERMQERIERGESPRKPPAG